SYPQIREGKIVGAVVTFIDITDRKRKEEKIQYLIGHDTLTGLQNRRGFEDNRTMLDIPANLPLSVIFADINGLKMTNDIFGHTSGDELIKKAAEILKRSCRENDLIARVGGDEFVLLLPKTTGSDAQMILERIGSEFLGARVEAVKCSTSLGLDTKTSPNQSLDEIIANAENKMYKNKILNRKTINKGMIDTLIETLYIRSPRERQHSIAVSELSSEVGLALHLSETEISKLGRTGYLHDIGKIVIPQSILSKELLSKEDLETIQQHPMVGYRILNLFDDTLDLAEYVYSHHERWDGKGYPQGLKNGHIPLISRIVSIVETYDSVISRGKSSHNEKKLEALEVIRKGAGTQFDPDIAELFVQMMEEKDS
ncbi:MAG TPA: HD domain-containing phosphohydrolase, partial [Sphaerochaeta sp.]|nr:HD domain-containing phosphohydrolase [Sphaerochaeta sp.]